MDDPIQLYLPSWLCKLSLWEMGRPLRIEREIFVNWNQFVKLQLELQLMMMKIIGEGEGLFGLIFTVQWSEDLQNMSI